MKTSTLLGLLLVGVLAVSWVTAEPLPDPEPEPEPESEPTDSEEEEPYDDSYETGHVRRRRQLHGSFGTNRSPFGRDYSASVGYNKNFNKGRTSVGVHGHRNWGASGKGHGAGFSFTHRFRR
ncbi:uncharacterized protein LOC126997567 [Eriocheir sinensis]|uniref:uncharacterized protein LOC126997567 n=1 Tax=Eriocheir sinensis TaxID=95602 RepID=UPI0021C82F58|nr:uncharacterized protein LOC126997567 [Eriocheir sinensis]